MAVETLGEAMDAGWRVHMRCAWGTREGMKSVPECRFRCELDVRTLVCTRGRDFPIARPTSGAAGRSRVKAEERSVP